jgi:hypothetical protein
MDCAALIAAHPTWKARDWLNYTNSNPDLDYVTYHNAQCLWLHSEEFNPIVRSESPRRPPNRDNVQCALFAASSPSTRSIPFRPRRTHYRNGVSTFSDGVVTAVDQTHSGTTVSSTVTPARRRRQRRFLARLRRRHRVEQDYDLPTNLTYDDLYSAVFASLAAEASRSPWRSVRYAEHIRCHLAESPGHYCYTYPYPRYTISYPDQEYLLWREIENKARGDPPPLVSLFHWNRIIPLGVSTLTIEQNTPVHNRNFMKLNNCACFRPRIHMS